MFADTEDGPLSRLGRLQPVLDAPGRRGRTRCSTSRRICRACSRSLYNGECVGIQLPAAVDLKIVECDPAVKGNSATSRTKPAKLETGVQVQVPEYLKEGEKIRVDTRSGEFLARA